MAVKHSHKDVDKTYRNSLLLAIGCAMLCILLGTMLLSTFLISGAVDVKRMDIGAAVVLCTAATIASFSLKMKIGEGSRGVILIFLGVLGIVLLLLNVVMTGGHFNGVTVKMGATLLGGSAMMFGSNRKMKRKKRRKNK